MRTIEQNFPEALNRWTGEAFCRLGGWGLTKRNRDRWFLPQAEHTAEMSKWLGAENGEGIW